MPTGYKAPANRTRSFSAGTLRVTCYYQEIRGGPILETSFETHDATSLADQIRGRTGRSCVDDDLVWDIEAART